MIEKKYIFAGVGAVVLIGGVLYLRMKPAPKTDAKDPDTSLSSPALMYMPSGGGSRSSNDLGANLPGIFGGLNPAGTGTTGQTGGTSLASLLAMLAGNKPATQTTPTTTQQGPITLSQIKSFVLGEEKAGVQITAPVVESWMKEYNVSLEKVGAAFGMDLAASNAWMKANPASTTPVAAVAPPNPPPDGNKSESTLPPPNRYASADIRYFISEQEKAGKVVNSTTIRQWIKDYNANPDDVAAAYGMTPAEGQAWLAAN